MQAFARIAKVDKIELLLVSGYSGIGKSSLVNEIYKPILQQRGYFIAGKFDQFQRDIPYASLIQAFRMLMQQLLAVQCCQSGSLENETATSFKRKRSGDN